MTIAQAVSRFGTPAKAKLANAGAAGEPEDQLRAPFERLVLDVATLLGLPCSAALFDTSALLSAGAFANAAGVQRRARQAGTSAGTARLEGFD